MLPKRASIFFDTLKLPRSNSWLTGGRIRSFTERAHRIAHTSIFQGASTPRRLTQVRRRIADESIAHSAATPLVCGIN